MACRAGVVNAGFLITACNKLVLLLSKVRQRYAALTTCTCASGERSGRFAMRVNACKRDESNDRRAAASTSANVAASPEVTSIGGGNGACLCECDPILI